MQAVDSKALAKSPLFRRLSELQATTGGRADIRTYKPGAVVWRRGIRSRFIYFVMQGRIALIGDDGFANPPVINLYGPGDLMGATAALLKNHHYYTAKAIEPVYLLRYSTEAFTRLMLRDGQLAVAAIKAVAANWHRVGPQVFELKRYSTNQRLAMYLLNNVEQRSGAVDIRLQEDQLLISGLLGTTRQSLSRAFAQLRPLGVRKRGRAVKLLDVARLRKFCAGGQRR